MKLIRLMPVLILSFFLCRPGYCRENSIFILPGTDGEYFVFESDCGLTGRNTFVIMEEESKDEPYYEKEPVKNVLNQVREPRETGQDEYDILRVYRKDKKRKSFVIQEVRQGDKNIILIKEREKND